MVKVNWHRIRRALVFGVLFCCLVLFINSSAFAQCMPGLPCTNSATSNDPHDGTISPNTSGPHAHKTTSDMCDADFMNQIYAKAFLEAERENILNEIVVRKPDSTMELTCYEQNVSITAHKAGPRFSETDYWWNRLIPINNGIGDNDPDWWDVGDVPVFVSMCPPDNPTYPEHYDGTYSGDGPDDPCEKLDKSLEDLVLFALYEYVSENFEHYYLGGYAAGINNDITGQVVGASYLCDMMYVVNIFARCDDFDTDDKFYEFEDLVSFDPRILPEQCTNGTPIEQDIIDVFKNDGAQYAAWDYTVMETYLDRILNVGDAPANDCGDPVPTGVFVRFPKKTYNMFGGSTTTYEEYWEHVCTNPGCTYNFQSSQCEAP